MKVKKVTINLDKRRHLVYDLDAIYELEQIYGSFTKAIKSVRLDAFDDTARVLYFGLRHEDETLSVAVVDQLINVTNRYEIIEKIIKAVSLSLPDSNNVQTNQQTQQPDNLYDSGWEWDWLYYIGTVLLGMSEAVFWRCTPRKLFSLWAIHKRVNGWDEEKETPEQTRARAWVDQYI